MRNREQPGAFANQARLRNVKKYWMLLAIGSVICMSAIQTLVISEAAQARCINYGESRYCLFVFEHREFFTSHGGYLLNTTLSSWCRIFSSRSRSRAIRI